MPKWKRCAVCIRDMIPELLSPAGSWESMVAAVYTGADAVYLGVGSFNARRHASNFSITEQSDATSSLREAVAFCHARGVKVHVALNTLVTDKEFSAALEIAKAACDCGADALIVQDRGLARRIHAAAPSMPLHASTQLSCHSPAGVRRLKDVGFSRVVLAREMSKKEIAACADLGVELEVFVHGALCMSVSGQCELSAMLGGRSGNRGLCAQPCRLPFAVGHPPKENEAALSLKDHSLYAHIDELKELGVASLKIEGRMKRPEYVAAATAVLRGILDEKKLDTQLLDDLQAVFSRTGFTDGYFVGKRDASLFGMRRAEDVASPAVLNRLAHLYNRELPRVPVTLSLTTEPLAVTATDNDGNMVSAIDETAPTLSQPLPPERLRQSLEKSGGTPFAAVASEPPAAAVPLSAVNALRRQVLEDLLLLRGRTKPICYNESAIPPKNTLPHGTLSGLVARVSSLSSMRGDADWWVLPLGIIPEAKNWGVEIPRGLFGQEEHILQQLQRAAEKGAAFALCNNVGAVPLAKQAGLTPIAGAFMNITNSESLSAAAEDGCAAAMLSFELTFPQMRFAQGKGCVGLFAYGRQPLMLLRACPVQAAGSCLACGGHGSLTDRRGTEFPIQCAGECSELLNAVPLYLADKLSELSSFDFLYLHFTDESPARVAKIIDEYRRGGKPPKDFTRGLYKRGVL